MRRGYPTKPGAWQRDPANPLVATECQESLVNTGDPPDGWVLGISDESATAWAARLGVCDGFVESRMR